MNKYRLAALGGTFDRLHLGHVQLINTALSVADKIVIGLCDQGMIKKKNYVNLIESYQDRYSNLTQLLNKLKAKHRAKIITLTDIFGTTLVDKNIDVLVITEQTILGGELINKRRIKKGMNVLPMVMAQMVFDDSFTHISSTAIRKGIVSRSGRRYQKLFTQGIKFDSKTINQLHLPQGKVVSGQKLVKLINKMDQPKIGLVGDVIVNWFLDNQLDFDLAIVDGKTQRNKSVNLIKSDDYVLEEIQIMNNPSTINDLAAKVIFAKTSDIERNQYRRLVIKFDGEEDLLALVLCLSMPLKSLVLYGQPKEGIGMIWLSEVEKIRLARFIDPKFI